MTAYLAEADRKFDHDFERGMSRTHSANRTQELACRAPRLWVERGGTGTPTLVLIHGLGVTGAVWQELIPFLERHWPGRWLIPDLRGHGRSEWARHYGYGEHAADVAGLLDDQESLLVVGHSMGGTVALALGAGWFGVRPNGVLAMGLKFRWQDDELARVARLASAPVRWLDDREEAARGFLKAAGLTGIVDTSSSLIDSGLVEQGGRYRLAADPHVYGVVGPAVADFYSVCRSPAVLVAAEHDKISSPDDIVHADPDAVLLSGVGHSPQLEAPDAVWTLIEQLAAKCL